jgi:hypothetical protein
MRLNGILSLAEDHFNAASDLAYERLQADRGASNAWAIAECTRKADEAAELLSVGLAAMCCEDAAIVVRGRQEELIDWIKAMTEIREELIA